MCFDLSSRMVVYNRYIFGTSIPTMYIMYVHVYVCTITVCYTFVVVWVGMYVSFVR